MHLTGWLESIDVVRDELEQKCIQLEKEAGRIVREEDMSVPNVRCRALRILNKAKININKQIDLFCLDYVIACCYPFPEEAMIFFDFEDALITKISQRVCGNYNAILAWTPGENLVYEVGPSYEEE